MRIALLLLVLVLAFSSPNIAQTAKKPVRIGVAGLVHSHVGWILNRAKKTGDPDIEVVGIAEPNREVAERYMKRYGLPMSLVYSTLEEMLDKTRPDAVTAFNEISKHIDVVKVCAPRGIHVMVEKPLAVSLDQAKQMEALAKKHNIHLLTNYETTWYGSNHKAYQMAVKDGAIGPIRRIVVHDGHDGPSRMNKEFVAWLTDPVTNGAGALFDFGCYGANLATWLLKGQRPTSVSAFTLQIQPDTYPKVDDDATIVLVYPKTQVVIQPSWNWPFSRKDMEVYGATGYVFTLDGTKMRVRLKDDKTEQTTEAAKTDAPVSDPFDYLAQVVRGETKSVDDLSSLQVNMVVMEILDAARRSAKEGGKPITLK
ncbi:Gfo/Idh/MocA family protein [Larkinella terrae]|uniref:Gfo/Idh/MocA family oxidoreductase n=1 Tax=Larkinella terrae TaxID=2025311 RepID=A0A7K0ETL6_9BACT|nr:Gfo/Idh/MocA family oxidoreductase [Larkinella terrae]MRS65155.1 gfo/Idh/MocA family oxidoreductase [Larkinella terrae]